jgi:hypothetical protein
MPSASQNRPFNSNFLQKIRSRATFAGSRIEPCAFERGVKIFFAFFVVTYRKIWNRTNKTKKIQGFLMGFSLEKASIGLPKFDRAADERASGRRPGLLRGSVSKSTQLALETALTDITMLQSSPLKAADMAIALLRLVKP